LLLIKARYFPEPTKESMLVSLKQGIRFVRQREAMGALIILAFCMTALAMPMRTYIPVFVKDIFHRGPETYGNLLSLMGVGSILGSLAMAALGNLRNKGRVALVMMIVLGGAISVFALAKSLPLDYLTLIVVGSSMMAVFATVTSLVQLITTNEIQLRLPRRNAHGQPPHRMARPRVHRPDRPRRERLYPGSPGRLFPHHPKKSRRPLTGEPLIRDAATGRSTCSAIP
jgi:MFS family permease